MITIIIELKWESKPRKSNTLQGENAEEVPAREQMRCVFYCVYTMAVSALFFTLVSVAFPFPLVVCLSWVSWLFCFITLNRC